MNSQGTALKKPTKTDEVLIKKIEAERKLRETAWEDLTTDQKLERMREQVKSNNQNIQLRLGELSKLVNKLENHSHKNNGDIVIPLKEQFGFGGCEQGARMPEGKVFF